MTKSRRFPMTWALYLFWAIFINVVNEWMIIPLAEDYAIFGVTAVVLLILLWLTSIPTSQRRRWITFTLYSLLLGYGLSKISYYPLVPRIGLGLIMTLGLFSLTWFYARVKVSYLALSGFVLFLASSWLPVGEWPFLTHFSVAYYGRMSLQPSDFSALPFASIRTATGTAVVTVENIDVNKLNFERAAVSAKESPTALQDFLQNYSHLYHFVTIASQNGHFSTHPTTASELAEIQVNDLINSFYPFEQANWRLLDGAVVQYMSPSVTPDVLAQMINEPANLPTNAVALGGAVEQQEIQNWTTLLTSLGVQPVQPELAIVNGYLEGSYGGRTIHLLVPDSKIVGYGSFTANGLHQVLLQGENRFDVVSLDTAPGQLATTFTGSSDQPLSNDVIVGPLTNSGPDAIFVNASPAFILQASGGQWSMRYTAPNPYLRFEAAVRFKGTQTPEIVTDDPSYIRNAPTRYFTSYTFREGSKQGQLVRNWRIYHTNLVNVHPVQFQSGGPQYLTAAIYGTGKFLILRRTNLPLLPIAIILLGLTLIVGWGLRLAANKGGIRRA